MTQEFKRVLLLVIASFAAVACGRSPSSAIAASPNAACASPLASKAWYMQSALLGYQDPQHNLGISFTTYDRFKSLGSSQAEDAFFDVPGGNYSFVPKVQQTSPGVFSLTFIGSGRFTGSNFGRPAAVELKGTVDESTGAADLTLTAEGSVFHLVIPATDTSGAVALSKRIAADIQSKDWSDVYDAFTPGLKTFDSGALLAKDLTSKYRNVSSACRLGPGQLITAQTPFEVLGDHFTDVLAITVTGPDGMRVNTFATIVLNRENGTWVFVDANPPGTTPGATGPQDFGIPAPPT